MWYQIFKFELHYRKARPATYIYFAILFLLSFLAISTDAVQIGGGAGLVKENAPATIATMMGIMSAFFMMITSAIMGVAVLRDFEHNTDSMMFVNPISKFEYLIGRFAGSFIVLLFVFSGMFFGFILGEFMPWRDADKLLAFNFWNYWQPFIVFVIPNLLFTGAIFFMIGALSRKMVVVYSSWIFIFIFYQVALILTREIDNQAIAALIDPFAITTMNFATQYWTVAEQNSQVVGLEGLVLQNRIIWLIVGLVIMIGGYFSFSFNVVRSSWFKSKTIKETKLVNTSIDVPKASTKYGLSTYVTQIATQTIFYFKQIFKSVPFQAMVLCGFSILILNSYFMGRVFGIYTYPTTYLMIEEIQGFNLFFLIILVSYAGELVWKERDAKIDLIYDAMPLLDFINLISKFFGLLLTYVTLLVSLIVLGVAIQTFKGYYNYEIGLYFSHLFSETLTFLVLFTILAFFIQVMVNHKFLGHALMVVFFLFSIVLEQWGVEHNLFQFGSAELGPYSDMNGYGHFVPGFSWYSLYWFGFATLLFAAAVIFSVRGSEAVMKIRWKVGQLRLTRPLAIFAISAFTVFLFSGFYIYYNTTVINDYNNSDDANAHLAKYEKSLKQYEFLPQPMIVAVNMKVDIYPSQRDYVAEGFYVVENPHEKPIEEVHIQLNPDKQFDYEYVRFDRDATIQENLEEFRYVVYDLKKPLNPGEEMKIEFKTMFTTNGIVEGGGSTGVVFNGTFFNSFDFPTIGYAKPLELQDDDDRKDNGLEPKVRQMERDDPRGLVIGALGDDSRGINFEIVISTEPDQIAIAPGYIQREWEENNRKYYHYKMDIPIENFYNIISARYEVERDVMIIKNDTLEKEIDLEIYYHKGHEYNLESMMKSMKHSFEYFSKNFSPYQYDQMRILEFPRYASFAQSFANTVPFSEAIGFMLKIEDEKDVDIAYYVTSHELAHQWWAHQVMSANVQGSTMIVESLSQYSALMVMKQEYPQEHMQEFLKEELNRYLRGRSREDKRENPLAKVENQQYIRYGKGAVIMYALQDYIGEDSVNAALRRYVRDWSDFDKNGRYSTTEDLLGYFREVTSDSLAYLIDDMFEKIVLFENKAEDALYEEKDNGKYEIELTVSTKKFEADSLGNTYELPLIDWVDIGVYGENEDGDDKLLYLKKHKMDQHEKTFMIEVEEEPSKAGIDPLIKLIDRNPDDNVKAASKKEAA
ncbi:MAG: M1 family aminopeptidase [Cyclobacteriaceae bacterium]